MTTIKKRKGAFLNRLKQQWMLQVFALMGMLFLLIFSYIPMTGIVLAFNNYKPKLGLAGFFTSPWVGLKWFRELFTDPMFWPIFRNTIVISLLKLAFSFPLPILFALALNEMKHQGIKRVVQTVSYLPHFLSWVIVHGILVSFLNSNNGVINQLLLSLGLIESSLPFLSSPQFFWGVATVSDIWKEMGWWAIIFLAAIAGVDVSMYEAAIVDGASRMQRMFYITLPSIRPTIVVVLILSLGNLLGGGLGGSNFEQSYLLGNASNNSTSQVLQTYTLEIGLVNGRFSFAAAVGLVQSLISVMLVTISNFVAVKTSGTGLF
ncbi:MAG: sugar ABC transporter permease [Clostridiales bacterium]|nr:sugar ABC transporter permease [Clostridiales bacterium]